MKNLFALVLLQLASAMIGLAYGWVYGEPWALVTIPLCFFGALAYVFARQGDRAADAERLRVARDKIAEEIRLAAELADPAAYHRDVAAVAYGEMDEEDFERKWAGHVPVSPRPPRRRTSGVSVVEERAKRFAELAVALAKATTDAERAAVRKEIEVVSATIQNELLAAQLDAQTDKSTALFKELFADVVAELATCHGARFRLGQYVRFLGTIWRVTDRTPCIGPAMKWWAYYVEQGDALTSRDVRHPDEKQLELAFPKAGEWWESAPCDKHPESYPPRQMAADITENYLEAVWVRCGCLVPINYGRGY